MKRISLEKLLASKSEIPYEDQFYYIKGLLDTGKIRPVLVSGTNGKRPALYREYWIPEVKRDYGVLEEELKYRMVPAISIDYYLAHPDIYEQDRPWVLLLNEFLKESALQLKYPKSVNERSFEIWGREKFLSREQGRKVLKRCGIEETYLNMYETTEPLACYTHKRTVPQNLLILENKDTFYSMRRHLMTGNDRIFGVQIGTLIYGAGKRILRSFQDFDICVEPYMKAEGNEIYYFGDLDYEGIGIYESLAGMVKGRWEIHPFLPAYEEMLKKAEQVSRLPNTKEHQNRTDCILFFSYFSEKQVCAMKKILEPGQYVPQEILNISDFSIKKEPVQQAVSCEGNGQIRG